ncbi:MAG TPA: protease modulator HflK [Candidatus Binatia bacterium]|jgi:membrane protease subunit HflK|nr:protease modulator HflK [Candidatus Binatia bacterium]
MPDQPHSPEDLREPLSPPETALDAGSQALSEALRSSFGIVKFVMAVLVLVFLGSGIFIVGPQEQAMRIHLGKPVGEGKAALLGPGLHLSWPYPIDEYIKVPISSIQKVTSTVGWFAITPAQEAAGIEPPVFGNTPINPLVDGYVLTADNNIIHTRATLTYHIADPVGYVFNFVNASNAVQNTLDSALLDTAAQFHVDDILSRDVARFKEAVQKRVEGLVEQQNLGIVVDGCQVQSRPPRQLKEAFDSVLNAELGRSKQLDSARSYQNQVTSQASADAQSRVNSAQSERARLVNDITSQAERFNEILPRYQENPALFFQQRLNETLGRALTNVQDKIFLAESANGKPKEFRALLNRPPPPKTEETKP